MAQHYEDIVTDDDSLMLRMIGFLIGDWVVSNVARTRKKRWDRWRCVKTTVATLECASIKGHLDSAHVDGIREGYEFGIRNSRNDVQGARLSPSVSWNEAPLRERAVN